jgi:rapamycin-insensitive companion of mTOR
MKLPMHLYGELVKTEFGLQLLKENVNVENFINDLEADVPILNKRIALWALGHIGSSERGMNFIENLGALRVIIEIAENSSILSLRGSAFQALCLLSNTKPGRKALFNYKWVSSSCQISLPTDTSQMFKIPSSQISANFKENYEKIDQIIEKMRLNPEENEVLSHVVGLGNVVRKNESEHFLKAKKQENSKVFESLALFHAVMSYLAVFNFRLQTRKIVHKLFDKVYKAQNRLGELDNYDSI